MRKFATGVGSKVDICDPPLIEPSFMRRRPKTRLLPVA
jgi:hypothetical protein